MSRTVFVPVDHATAVALRGGESLSDRAGFGATADLLRMLGPGTDEEEAEYAALSCAATAALQTGHDPLRLVLAVEPAADPPDDPADGLKEWGQVSVRELRWADVRALFSDDPAATDAVAEARQAAAGRALSEVAELPAVRALEDSADLLWYHPDELDQLVG